MVRRAGGPAGAVGRAVGHCWASGGGAGRAGGLVGRTGGSGGSGGGRVGRSGRVGGRPVGSGGWDGRMVVRIGMGGAGPSHPSARADPSGCAVERAGGSGDRAPRIRPRSPTQRRIRAKAGPNTLRLGRRAKCRRGKTQGSLRTPQHTIGTSLLIAIVVMTITVKCIVINATLTMLCVLL